jgi:hypothetical protein
LPQKEKDRDLRLGLVVGREIFLRSQFGGLKVCFRFDSRGLAAYAVLLVFCWCFVVVKVIGGRSFETLDPSEVYLAEISSKTNKPSSQLKPEFITRIFGIHNEKSTGKSTKDGAEAVG